MSSGRIMNLMVTIPAESRRMNVGKDVIRVLGSPTYICVLQRKDRKSIAITPCTAEHPMSFKVPDRLLTDVGAKFIMPVPCKHRVLRAPLEQQVRIEDSHATIVTPEEFEQAQIQNRNFRLL